MSNKVAIVDYDCGNLFSVRYAFEHVGAEPYFVTTAEELLQADRVLLPGVGAFGDAAKAVSERGLDDAIREVAGLGRPTLGICLGMQLLVDESEEMGRHAGLGLLPGRVVELPRSMSETYPRLKVPNVGWARLDRPESVDWSGTLLGGVEPDSFVYFVHSFHAGEIDPNYVLATQRYGDIESPAVIGQDNVMGCQFHPERSGAVGLSILERWLNL